MPVSLWPYVLIGLGIVGQATLLAAIVRSGRRVQWASLWTLSAIGIVFNLVEGALLSHRDLYAAYFYIGWSGEAVQSLVRVWIILSIATSIDGLDFLPRHLYATGVAFVTFAACSAAIYAYYASPHLDAVLSCVVLFNRAVTFGWMIAAALIALAAKMANLLWSNIGSCVAFAVGTQIMSEAISSYLRSQSQSLFSVTYHVDAVVHVATYLYLAIAFFRPARIFGVQPPLEQSPG